MHLIEVVIAGSIFAITSSSSLQLWSATAVRAHQLSTSETLELQIEQDRLQLQTLWRSSPRTTADTSETNCSATAEDLLALAASEPVTPSLRRESRLSPDGQAVEIEWSGGSDPKLQRTRVITPAGLGLCGLPPAQPADEPSGDAESSSDTPLTDSQVEGLGS